MMPTSGGDGSVDGSVNVAGSSVGFERSDRMGSAARTRDVPSAPLRVAFVGAGTMARHHARALARLTIPNRVELVFDPDAAQREALLELCPGARGEAEPTVPALRGEVDVVHICSPPATHAALARVALEAGCHVYVEKPFARTAVEAERMLALARERELRVCAGHQLLFERPTREALEQAAKLGRLSHIESYFAFRPTRSKHGAGLPADEQLLDVLPHPLYLLLGFLASEEPHARPELQSSHVGCDGTLHASIRAGGLLGTLTVTLTGRPVESYVKLVGTHGTLVADHVRGIVVRSIGPGTSSLDKALQPFRTARQLAIGTLKSLVRRAIARRRSYPGLAEILEAFYRSVTEEAEPPLTEAEILDTVRLFEAIASSLDTVIPVSAGEGDPVADPGSERSVVVTGGTGFLGRQVVRVLLRHGARVRVLSRKAPAAWEREKGAEYAVVDLAAGCDPAILGGFQCVVHCAAETRGGREAHRRNSIEATERLLRSARSAGVRRIVHVSSLAVLARPERGGRLTEESDLEPDAERAGPYVWGKLNSEKLARDLGEELGLEVKIVRPGAIVDQQVFEAPGRLGRRFGNLFVAVGRRRDPLGVVDLTFAARTLAWMALHFEEAPPSLNLLSPDLPTRRDLVARLRAREPDLRVVWLPGPALKAASWAAVLVQKALRRGKEPIRLDRAFASEPYDTSLVETLSSTILEWDEADARSETIRRSDRG